ncbi:uncharacterized protein LOC131675208 isoform X2 [Phymastichus coffea]|uniref:uncharacterized protein LOC131675208 isoform X2 n=1 Tax=Phymastichus coffea TaxID=108790 RepID=UPI00273B0D63|nr:uncharacterized protein LOC131675208 isoform X2 [Phymastichus coffea]
MENLYDTATPIQLSLVKVKKKFEAESELHLQESFTDNKLALAPSNSSLNVFHSTDLLQCILNINKITNIISHKDFSPETNEKICTMIQDTISHDSISRMQLILSQMDELKFEEKLLLYLKLPTSLINSNVMCDPLKQPLNPLGNRYEIHQTIMWIKTHLEEDPEVSLPKQDVYDEYNIFCSKNNMKPLSTADFGKVMKQVYPRVRPRRLGTRGNSRYCYAGLRKKLILKPPTLPSTYDKDLGGDGEYNTKEDMLGAASILIREWAETYFNVKFPTLCTLGKYLVDNLFVDNQSLAAICIMSSSENFQSSTRNTDIDLGSPETTASGKIAQFRDTQLLLQRKIQQRDHKYQISCSSEYENRYNRQVSNMEKETKNSNRNKDSNSNQLETKNFRNMLMKISKINIPSYNQKRKIRQINKRYCSSPLSICDMRKVQAVKYKEPNLSDDMVPWREKILMKQESSNKTRKRANSCAPNLSEIGERIPEKALKFIDKESNIHSFASSVSLKSINSSTPIEMQTRKTPMILAINPKVSKNTKSSNDQPLTSCDKNQSLSSKNYFKSTSRSEGSNLLNKSNQLFNNENFCFSQKQLRLKCDNIIEDYLNIHNSQEQEEELLQYFQQNSSSSSDAELSKVSEVVDISSKSSRQDKVSQLRIILQNNLKDLTPTSCKSNKDEIPNKQLKKKNIKSLQEIPASFVHQNANRRHVSFDVKLTEQCTQTTGNISSSNIIADTLASITIPCSPNTRRRIFDFTPISPTPSHSPINFSVSKCNSADGSPFVSPRNTPIPRSRSNLQRSSSWRARSSQQQNIPRSNSSCNVDDFIEQNPLIIPEMTAVSAIGVLNNESLTFTNSCITHPFLSDLTSQEPQLLINYPSQENLQEIKNVSNKQFQPTDKEISDLLLNEKQLSFSKDQSLFYRSQSVPLHRMVNPALLSPILTHQLTPTPTPTPTPTLTPTPTPTPTSTPTPIPCLSLPHKLNIPQVITPVLGDSSDFNSSTMQTKLSLDDKYIIPSNLNMFGLLNTSNEKIDISHSHDAIEYAEQEESKHAIIDSVEILNETVLSSDLTPRWFGDDGTCVSNHSVKSISSRSYPNTPLPLTNSSLNKNCFDDNNVSKSQPSTPMHSLQSLNSSSCFYLGINEPMLCSPTLGPLSIQDNTTCHIGSACPTNKECNVTDFLEPDLPNNETDDLDSLTNFGQLQDVDTLTPLFSDVVESNH